MADDYVELSLRLAPNADTQIVREWLERHSLSVMKMKLGFLLSGTRDQIEKVFSVSLENIQPPFELPVPKELKDQVKSITLPKPRSYHV